MQRVDAKEIEQRLKEFRFRGHGIPAYTAQVIIDYLCYGVPPGGALEGVLENDLKKAVSHAGDFDMWLLPIYLAFFYNEAPSDSWGTAEKVAAWIAREKT